MSTKEAWQCSDGEHKGQACGLLHRKDFELKHIRQKLLIGKTVVYVVRWKSTWVPAKLIVDGNDLDYPYVDADGTKWYIKRTYGRRERDGIEEVRVKWANTKEPPENLSNAREAIAIFEANSKIAGSDEIARVRQRKLITFSESKFPRGSVLPQSENEYHSAQRWLALHWPMIRPHPTVDLYPAFYRVHMELHSLKRGPLNGGMSYRGLMKLPQRTELRWHNDYLHSGRVSRCCSRKRASLFVQATGVLANHPCTRCQDWPGPFVECVRTAPDQQLWLNGACASCGTRRNSGCDFHQLTKERSRKF